MKIVINSKAFDILNDKRADLKENKITLLDGFFWPSFIFKT